MSHGIRAPGLRLPDETHLGGVVLQVSDLDRSLGFYRDVLGFAVVGHEDGRVLLGADQRSVLELRAGAADPLQQRRLGLYHFAILLPNRASLGRCLAHLLDAGMQPGASDHLVSEAIYIQDPDGLGIEIYRDRPREEWSVTGQELAMATKPLDIADVISAGGGTGWHGMPAGTVIGHIHLHVGDLNEAKSFYHVALGLDLMVWSYPGALFLSAGGYHHHLGVNTWAGASARAAGPSEPKLLQWQLVLPSHEAVSAAAAQLAENGYQVVRERDGAVKVADPWSTMLCLTTAA